MSAAVSDTPKTDAFQALVNRPMDWWDWARQLERENADLHDTIDAVITADERAIELWRAAHPGNELVIPDRAKLVGWLLEQNAALRKDYVEMGKTALKSEINHYIGSIIMTDEQRKLREAVKKKLPERASWAEIYAVYEMVRNRTKEAKP